MRKLLWATTFAIGAQLAVQDASAWVVQPLAVEMTSAGKGSSSRVAINGDADAPIDVVVDPQRVEVDSEGRRIFTSEPADFIIFPPQATVPANGVQTLSLRYVGSPSIAKGAIYNLHVRQTNVSETPKQAVAISFLLAFNVTVVVNPPGATANVRISGAPVFKDGVTEVTVENTGTAVANLSTLGWTAVVAGKKEPIAANALSFGSIRYLPPGQTRIVRVKDLTQGASIVLASAR